MLPYVGNVSDTRTKLGVYSNLHEFVVWHVSNRLQIGQRCAVIKLVVIDNSVLRIASDKPNYHMVPTEGCQTIEK